MSTSTLCSCQNAQKHYSPTTLKSVLMKSVTYDTQTSSDWMITMMMMMNLSDITGLWVGLTETNRGTSRVIRITKFSSCMFVFSHGRKYTSYYANTAYLCGLQLVARGLNSATKPHYFSNWNQQLRLKELIPTISDIGFLLNVQYWLHFILQLGNKNYIKKKMNLLEVLRFVLNPHSHICLFFTVQQAASVSQFC